MRRFLLVTALCLAIIFPSLVQATTSVSAQVQLATNAAFVLKVQAALVTTAINVSNEVTNEVQTIGTSGSPTAGTFTVHDPTGAGTSAIINWNDTSSSVQGKLQAISQIGVGGVICTGGPLPGTAITCTFTGANGNTALPLMTLGTNSLTGGSTPAPTFGRTTSGVSVVNHAARATLANQILLNPSGFASLFAWGVASNTAVQTDWGWSGSAGTLTITQPSPGSSADLTDDTNILNAVSGIFNAYHP